MTISRSRHALDEAADELARRGAPSARLVGEAPTRDGDLDASEIVVTVEDGEVTLEGTVRDRRSKRLAEDLAGQRGVRDVHNRLRVEGGG